MERAITANQDGSINRADFFVRSYKKMISVTRGKSWLSHLQRLCFEVIAGLARFRVIVLEKVSPVKWDPCWCQPVSRQRRLACLLYDRGNVLQATSELKQDFG